MSVNQKVLDAIELLTKNSVQKASYDKTIQAQIISCEDATIGKYKCRYQDSTFYAYASNAEVSYSNKAMVYVLVPGNDMSRDKTILGTTKKLGINYITQAEGDEAYDKIGKNCIKDEALKKKFYLDTNYDQYIYTIYSDNNAEGNDILNLEDAEQYITKSSSLLVGATFKTNIDITKQLRGHYGIIYNLQFKDNATGDSIIKSYAVEVNNMSDNPYRLVAPTRQYKLFDIDGVNFEKVKSIQIFCKDFPESTIHTPNNIKLNAGDIEITALQLYGTARMTQQEINGVAISFYTPKGTFFTSATDEDNEKNTKIITAQVRIKGKLVSTTSQKLEFYWGKQNLSVTNRSQYYNKKLGRGWKCLNEFNIISSADDGYTEPIVEWVPGNDTIYCKPSEATARDNRFKVAVVYDGNVITKEINIQNLNNKPNIIIESDSGVKFYYDVGHPTLTCKVFGSDGNEIDVNSVTTVGGQIKPNYIFTWGIENTDGMLELLEVTPEEKRDYDIISALVQKVQEDIDKHHKPIANAALLDKLLNGQDGEEYTLTSEDVNYLTNPNSGFNFGTVKKGTKILSYNYYKNVQIIEHNKILNFQIRSITGFATIKCAVQEYSKENGYVYKGTGSIKLINSLQPDSTYSLGIENGKVSFKYNENGVAPTSNSVDHPQEIFALKAQLFDENGNEIDERVLQTCPITWKFPLENTLLDINTLNLEEDVNYEEKDGYGYYSNSLTFIYNINKTYNIRKQDNQIELIVDYKDFHLTTKTDFVFLKEGQPGSNGTEYVIKIVPRNENDLPIVWSSANSDTFFDVQVWKNGELYWNTQNKDVNLDDPHIPNKIIWEFLTNPSAQSGLKIGNNDEKEQASSFSVVKNQKTWEANVRWITYTTSSFRPSSADFFTKPKADILKCTVVYGEREGNDESKQYGSYPQATKNYYGTLPIPSVYKKNSKYGISLKEGTGFKYVVYSSDGQFPQYDSTFPFEIIVKKNNEDISLDATQGSDNVQYNFYTLGYNDDLIKRQRNDNERNQCTCIPIDRYSGEGVNNNLICSITTGTGAVIATMRIPVHFMLNRYELSHLNDWDGNSIEISNDEGYILAPQMGAGRKEEDNSFTGVLMGEVKKSNYSNVGLFGYSGGQRSFFLNSENGSTILGSKKNSQIIMDPSADQALIYSSNFWQDSMYNTNTGLPNFQHTDRTYENANGETQHDYFYLNYREDDFRANSNTTGKGLLINLTQPQIFSGDARFYLHDDGGKIGGWTFDTHRLIGTGIGTGSGNNVTTNNETNASNKQENQAIVLDATRSRIYSGDKDQFSSTRPGFHLSPKGLVFGDSFKLRSAHYDEDNNKINAKLELGTLSGRHWVISSGNTNSYIAYMKTYGNNHTQPIQFHSGSSTGLQKIGIGRYNENGEEIKEDVVEVYIGTNGISLGRRFSVDAAGNLRAYTGKIGGWTIDGTTLSAQNIVIDSNGSIRHQNGTTSNWRINSGGSAYFRNVTSLNGSIGTGYSLTGSNFTFGGGGSAGSYINPNGISSPSFAASPAAGTLAGEMVIKCKGVVADWVSTTDLETWNLNWQGYSVQMTQVVTDIDDITLAYEPFTNRLTLTLGISYGCALGAFGSRFYLGMSTYNTKSDSTSLDIALPTLPIINP